MKKLLIATTALVATAGMASADITITGSANAGYYNELGNADAVTATLSAITHGDGVAGRAAVTATSAETFTESGIYSNAGIVATMTGTTDGGITFSTSIDAEAGQEVDTGDFELDGAASGAFGFGNMTLSGGFGTLTFDNAGIDNLYDDDLTAADVKYSTTVGGLALTIAADAQGAADGTSVSAGYTSGAMSFTALTSDSAAGTSASLAVSYVVSDALTVRADTDQAAGAESVQSIGLTTALSGVSIVADTSNNSTWDVSLGYTVNGVALSYANDEADAWSATASMALGGGATAKAGINSESSMYAGVSFAF